MLKKPKFKLLQLDDNSHAKAKRYSAHFALLEEMDREQVMKLIPKMNRYVKNKGALQEVIERGVKGRLADVVFLFVYASEDDYNTMMAGEGITWICRGQWTNSDLPSEFRPLSIEGEKASDGSLVEFR